MVHLGNDWDTLLTGEFQQEYYKKIRYWLKKEYAEQTGRTLTTAPGRRTASVFPSSRAYSRRRAC